MSLTNAQLDALLAPLSRGRVRKSQGMDHLEAWDDRRWLLRIFGWGGFDIEADETLVSERSVWDENNPLKGRHTVVYRVKTRLTIKDPDGNLIAHFEDGAVGDAQNQPSLGDAHDQALKTAHSQALKRCCVNLGDAFGLSLYAKSRMEDGSPIAVVGKSIAHPGRTEHKTQEEVTAGEMDAPRAGEEAQSATTNDGSGQATSPKTPASDPQAGRTLPAAAPIPPEPAPQQEANNPEHIAEKLRDRALALYAGRGDRKRNEVIQDLGRVGLEASGSRVQQVMVRRENGEQVTLSVLLDELIKNCTRSAA